MIIQRIIRHYKKPLVLTSAAITGLIFFVSYYSYSNYSQLTISQLEANNNTLSLPLQDMTQLDLENNPKLKTAIEEVASKYVNIIRQNCQPKEIAKCDVSGNTQYTTELTPEEYKSIRDSLTLSSTSGGIVGGWFKYDCSDSDYYISLGKKLDYCYYTVTLTRNS